MLVSLRQVLHFNSYTQVDMLPGCIPFVVPTFWQPILDELTVLSFSDQFRTLCKNSVYVFGRSPDDLPRFISPPVSRRMEPVTHRACENVLGLRPEERSVEDLLTSPPDYCGIAIEISFDPEHVTIQVPSFQGNFLHPDETLVQPTQGFQDSVSFTDSTTSCVSLVCEDSVWNSKIDYETVTITLR